MIRSAYSSLLDFFTQLYRPRRLLGCSKNTISAYLITINHFKRYLRRDPLPSDLDEDMISDFLDAYGNSHAPGSVSHARKQLMALGAFAYKRGIIPLAPDVARVRVYRRAPDSHSVTEVARLLAAAGNVAGKISGVPAQLYWVCFLSVAFDTAARPGAIRSLHWIDFTPPLLRFRAETQKQRADQVIRVRGETALALESIRSPPRELIFPFPWTKAVWYTRLHAIYKAAGLPHGRRDLLQKMRRTTLTLAHRAGVDATAQAGHSSDAVTRLHYLDATNQRQAADILPAKMLPAPERQRMLF